ncbi:PREDICTED: putative nuclease HARBI1 [Rhagoletis zephyria]|uniref:putative nuclease HARBI1 n=1 Tax=Rhagoletis zephyria TaxID=28612 RepID=UPI0008115AE7|nr:PREDICTED: putative nuclease HARBI1 [Rhagoletis zephyria]XP_017469036.1 PREDICTED: putative nuclease HARBI1 [Rhagoletis zephyria]
MQTSTAFAHSEIRSRPVWKFDRNGTFWEFDVFRMDDHRFKENFRLNKSAFQKVCEKVQRIEKMDTNMRLCIPLHKRVAIALFALGSSAEYRTVASLFGVGRSTVVEIVLYFCNAVCDNLLDCINSYPPHPEELKKIVHGFGQLGFPQCFGAIDGCHIEVQPKKEDAIDYYNYKGWYSVNLFASCDYRSKFTDIHVGSSGRNNDSYIFESSSLKSYHENADIFQQNSKRIGGMDVPLLLIGDSAFRLSRYLMKPFPFHRISQLWKKRLTTGYSDVRA